MSGRLPTWLEAWFGIESASPGEGTVWRLDMHWNWAPWATLLFAGASAAWIVYWYAKETPDTSRVKKILLAGMRLVLFGLLLLMVAELVVTFERTGLPTVVVLVDNSASMGTVDGEVEVGQSAEPPSEPSEPTVGGETIANTNSVGEPNRLELAKQLLLENNAKRLRRIDDQYKLALYSVATSAIPLGSDSDQRLHALERLTSDEPESGATRLGAAVRQVLSELKGSPPAAIVLMTDGVTTDGSTLSDAAELAAQQGVPLFTIGVGDDRPVYDVELVDLLVDDVVFAGDVVSFDATLIANGLEGKTTVVELREKRNENVLAETTVVLEQDGAPQKVRLPYRPLRPGDFEYTVTVRPLEGENQIGNNKKSRLVRIREQTVRVLLVGSTPSYEYRFLKNMLERDVTIDLRVFLQDADQEYAVVDQTALSVFPVRGNELFQFDVLILNDVDLRRLTRRALANIKEFVIEKGGGLVWIAGERFSEHQLGDVAEVASLLPFSASAGVIGEGVVVDGFSIRPTDLGQASPTMQLGDTRLETMQIWQNLPPLFWLLEIGEPKPAARVLAVHPSRIGYGGRKQPIVMMQFVGAGKVLFHATDETWRWRYRVGDLFYARYWVQSLRRLARSKLLGGERGVELTVDRKEYRHGDPVHIRVRFFDESLAPTGDDAVQVVVEQTGQKRRRIPLRRGYARRGVFEGALSETSVGRFHVLLVQPTVEGRAPFADFRVVAPPGEFERLEMDVAELSSAASISNGRFYRINEASDMIKDLPEGRQVPIQQLPARALWNSWWMISLFIGLLVSEWVLRKRNGML